ncbi:MAG: dTDP-4-dehydrorhamnose 3,5-epimerase family protein [Chromatiales bacterium]
MIDGVDILTLAPRPDHRGTLTTLYLRNAYSALDLPQWNLVRSDAHVLRGMHAHLYYDEYYVPLAGPMFFALADIRPRSPTYRQTMTLRWDGRDRVLLVPKGVAHGVYGEEPFMLLYGLSRPFDGRGELGCRFDDPELGLEWPTDTPVLSEKDEAAGSYGALLAAYADAEAAL